MRKYLKIAVLVFPLSCTEIERDNPYDEHYVGNASKEGSSSSVESLSVPSSGSLGGGYSGSYGSLTYEGKTYKTVVIGTQTWMAENLNYAVSGSKCYNNLEANCTIYGRLYNLETAKTVCPSGWHLPTDDEWRMMTDYIGDYNTGGKKLKATSGWNNNGNGTDEYGFSALPGGQGSSGGNFIYVGALGVWWTASEYVDARSMAYNSESVLWNDNNESSLLSVRCVSGNQLSITGFDITDYPTTGILLSGEVTGETVTGVTITANGNAVSLINLPALGVNRVDLSGTYVSGVCGTSSEIITVNFAITATASGGTTVTATKNNVSIDCGVVGPDPPLVKTHITLSSAGNSYADLDNGKTYGQEAAAAIKNKIDLIAYSGEVGESGNLGAIYTPDELDFFWDFDGNYWSYLGGDVYFSPIPTDVVAILRNATKFSDIAAFVGGLWYDDFEGLTEIPAVKDTGFLVSTTERNIFAVTIESAGEGRVDLVIVDLW